MTLVRAEYRDGRYVDCLDGAPLIEGTRLRVRWPDGHEAVDVVRLQVETKRVSHAYFERPLNRWLWLAQQSLDRGMTAERVVGLVALRGAA